MTLVPAVTENQPKPALVAAGVVSMLTRSSACPSELIGGRLILHAGEAEPVLTDLRVWLPLDRARRAVEPCARCGHGDGSHVCHFNSTRCVVCGCNGYELPPLPRGAVVASCVVSECLPIIDATAWSEGEGDVLGGGVHWPPDRRSVCSTGALRDLHNPWVIAVGGGREKVEYHEGAFGDFSPGNFAWILSSVEPTSRRCPHCWGEGFVIDPLSTISEPSQVGCPTCHTRKSCPPVPMRGHSGLWYPKWEDDRA